MISKITLLASWSWELDGWIVAAGVLCAVASALLGNFLVLRKMSMLGDAISHAVLPGLAVAFMVTGSRNSLPMFVGAVVVGVLTAFFTEWIRSVGKVDEGAAMGVVFTSLFALGLVMIVQAVDHVDLDPGCVLYGAIELTPLEPPVTIAGLSMPPAVLTLGVVVIINLTFVVLFFKELKISSFDPELSTSIGFSSRLMHYALMVLVAITAVASFETVGNILVVAMFVVPPAAAYMLTNRLSTMIGLSVLLAIVAAVLGHVSAITVPGWFGFQSTTTAGMMAVAAGGILFLTILFAPERGVVVKWVRRIRLSYGILADDVIAFLYRFGEKGVVANVDSTTGQSAMATFEQLQSALFSKSRSLRFVLAWLGYQDLVSHTGRGYELTRKGTVSALELVRSHRLWEQYLVTRAGLGADRIHDKAERMEHFTDKGLRERLSVTTDAPTTDPHGASIPPEGESSGE